MSIMNIVIDTLPHDRGGGITYLKNILPYLSETDDRYYVLVPQSRDKLNNIQFDNVEIVSVKFPVSNLLFRLFYQQIILPFILYSLDTDVLYSPGDITTFLAPCPTAVAVRNPNPYFKHSNHTTKNRIRFLIQRYLSRLSVIRSATVIFVSNYSKEQMNQYLHTPEEKSYVIHHGINISDFQGQVLQDSDGPMSIIQESPPFILCVSTIYKHKNYETLIQAYANLSAEIRDEYPLVIAGGHPDEDYYKSIVELTKSKGVEDDVLFLGRVDYELIPKLYTNAAVSVLPSKLETFGHPLVEAMAAGTPVIASNSTCIPEITNGAARLFNPNDYGTLCEHIETVLTDEEVAEQLVSDGYQRVQDFSWKETAHETHKALRAASE